MDNNNRDSNNNINITNTIYLFAEKYGEFCGNILSGIINMFANFTANYVGVLNAGYNGFKDRSQPAVEKLLSKCQNVLDNNNKDANSKQ